MNIILLESITSFCFFLNCSIPRWLKLLFKSFTLPLKSRFSYLTVFLVLPLGYFKSSMFSNKFVIFLPNFAQIRSSLVFSLQQIHHCPSSWVNHESSSSSWCLFSLTLHFQHSQRSVILSLNNPPSSLFQPFLRPLFNHSFFRKAPFSVTPSLPLSHHSDLPDICFS